MSRSRHGLAVVGLALLLTTAGCGAFAGGDTRAAPESAVTPAPVPTPTAAAPNGPSAAYEYWGSVTATGSELNRTWLRSLEPTCERPPGLVVHIQVSALRTDDPETHAGIETAWRFAAPSNRASFASYESFVSVLTDEYRPLLDAESVTYDSIDIDRARGAARRNVTVYTPNGTAQSYTWIVERQTTAPHEGCWMTTGVVET
ncbi:DUF4864 domain-containing protein [Halomicroarcula sp. GCM10025709]|uniref:DUF4864 domain-containing protein n=1 Tax=Haloarcula TaxID=2237 RepID=UPI0024C33311|nr:DUF4864 domain-containing protein [Halomicroarcula sp. YJ-61-S]